MIKETGLWELKRYQLDEAIRRDLIVEALELCKTDVVLDIGCGVGYISATLAQQSKYAVGIDLIASNLAIARSLSRGMNCYFMKANGIRLPFDNETFDKIVCTEVIEHIESDISLLKEINRVLKKGGTLALTTPNITPSLDIFHMMNRIRKRLSISSMHDEIEYEIHVREGYELGDLKNKLHHAGLSVERECFYLPVISKLIQEFIYTVRLVMGYRKTMSKTLLTDGIDVTRSLAFRALKIAFPLLSLLNRIDTLVFGGLKGHGILVVARARKPEGFHFSGHTVCRTHGLPYPNRK